MILHTFQIIIHFLLCDRVPGCRTNCSNGILYLNDTNAEGNGMPAESTDDRLLQLASKSAILRACT